VEEREKVAGEAALLLRAAIACARAAAPPCAPTMGRWGGAGDGEEGIRCRRRWGTSGGRRPAGADEVKR
jgi:hypothetical protein